MTDQMPRPAPAARDATRPVPVGGPGGRAATHHVPVVVPRQLGDYDLLDRVGEGGMGVVWRAADRGQQGREVAIKVLRPHIAHDEQARERLRREVHTLARVHHPRVAAVVDADVDGPAPYIVTDFVPGPPLDAVVDQEGPLQGEELLRVARGLAGALHAIHEVGIVHRDLKPGNVLLVGRPGRRDPVVIDFGIAQVADDVRLTSTGLVMGTPGYLSPEVAEGGEVGQATDWWGWAATLAYAASGQPPFGRGPVTVVLDRVARGRLQLDGVDPRLRPLLAAALDPDPARRPTESQVLDGLERFARNQDVTGALPRLDAHDRTQLHDLVDPTRVAPHPPAARTRRPAAAPERPDAWPDTHPERGGRAYTDGGAYPADQGLPEEDERPLDPRIGRRARTGTLTALLVGFVALASVLPLVAWGIYAVWGLTSRAVDRTVTGLVLRRYEAGRRASDVPLTVLAAPVHLVTAAVATVFALLLPVAMAAVTALVLAGLVTRTELFAGVGPEHPLTMAAGALIGGVLAWWGLGSTSLRRGSRTVVRAVVPDGAPTRVVVGAVLFGALGFGVAASQAGDLVSWWPLPPGTTLLGLLPFDLP